MRILLFCLLVEFLFIACSEENPTDFSVYNSTANESSSSVQEIGSSSSNISSSSNDVYSSNLESSSSNLISSSSTIPVSYGELIDERDGQIYKTVKIGEQTWMAENLNFDYHNPFAPTPALAAPSYCYDNSQDNCKRYGRLYRWSNAMDSAAIFSKDGYGCGTENSCGAQPYKGIRGVCPEHWHIPTNSDVENLIVFSKSANENRYWLNKYWLWAANDDSVFKNEMTTKYSDFWSSVESDYKTVLGISLYDEKEIRRSHFPKGVAISVRCVKDSLPTLDIEFGEMTDERDGQVYKTIKIGEQTWMAENLNYAYLHSIRGFSDSSSFCYNDVPDSCAKYGRLYPWNAAMDSLGHSNEYGEYDQCGTTYEEFYDVSFSGICPPNWHIPSVSEWNALLDIVNNFTTNLKSKDGWIDDGNGYDILGFRLLPAGRSNHNSYIWIGKKTCFWTPLQYSNIPENLYCGGYSYAWRFCFSGDDSGVSFDFDRKEMAYSVRCVKGPPTYED